MRSERVEVRLDKESRVKLEEVAAARGISVSELMRSLIEDSYQQEISHKRLAASEHLGELEIEDVPDPGELKRQFSEAHGEVRSERQGKRRGE